MPLVSITRFRARALLVRADVMRIMPSEASRRYRRRQEAWKNKKAEHQFAVTSLLARAASNR